jgi:hypothetical protein
MALVNTSVVSAWGNFCTLPSGLSSFYLNPRVGPFTQDSADRRGVHEHVRSFREALQNHLPDVLDT